jgi:hypothetical protein
LSWLRSLLGRDELPVTPLEEVVAGRRVKVKAFLELVAAPLVAPISGRKCAGCSFQLFKRDGEDCQEYGLDGGLLYREAVLREAVEVTVIGVADREADPRARVSYREAAPTRVVFSQAPIRVSHD